MAAYIDFSFKGKFFLDEEKIRRIHRKLLEREGTEGGNFNFICKISRSDGLVYLTKNVEKIFSEENSLTDKITRIEFISHDSSKIDYHLSFDKNRRNFIRIAGENRDNVYLIYSDLKDYIQSNVFKRPLLNMDVRHILPFFTVLFVIIFAYMITSIGYDNTILDNVARSNNIQDKLNYIILRQRNVSLNYLHPILLLMFFFPVLVTLILYWKNISDFLFPGDIFLIGEEVQNYEAFIKIRGKMFWGIFVAIIIGVIGNIVTPLVW